jgi:hypothetical protein
MASESIYDLKKPYKFEDDMLSVYAYSHANSSRCTNINNSQKNPFFKSFEKTALLIKQRVK